MYGTYEAGPQSTALIDETGRRNRETVLPRAEE
jgi:hypothetical protein